MWHRFSVVLAAIMVSGFGYFAVPFKPAADLTPANVNAAEATDTVAARGHTHSQSRGSGRRMQRPA